MRTTSRHQLPLQPIRTDKPKPAVLAQSAVGRIPRWLLWGLALVYALAGFVGRSPWQGQDLESYGIMLYMAEHGWSLSQAAQSAVGQGIQPLTALPYWFGALAIQIGETLTPFLHAHSVVSIAFASILLWIFALVWYACYYLARTTDAQPLPFALGGEAQPVDYARSLADAATLAFMGCLGLMQIGHEHSPSLTQLLCVSLWLFGMAIHHRHIMRALVSLALAYVGLCLSGGISVAILLALVALCVSIPHTRNPLGALATHGLLLGFALLCAMAVFEPNAHGSTQSQTHNLAQLLTSTIHTSGYNVLSIAKLLIWFTWPAGMLGILAIWKWRGWLTSLHIALPALMALAVTVFAIYTHGSGFDAQRILILALPAVACLASFALPTAARDFTALIDWFTLIFFCVCGLAIWIVWLSLQTGFPEQPARNVAKLLYGYESRFYWKPFLLAVLASLAWLWLVYWRVGKHRSAIWKSVALPAGGAALCWLLLTTLWLPVLNYARGYGTQTSAAVEYITQHATPSQPDTLCAYTYGLRGEQVASLYHDAGVRPVAVDKQTAEECGWLLVSPDGMHDLHSVIGEQLWELRTKVQRPSARNRTHPTDIWLFQRPAWQAPRQ